MDTFWRRDAHLERILWFFATISCLAAFSAVPSRAQTTQNCQPAVSDAYLSGANVWARITNNGGLFWRGDPSKYEVPKGSGHNTIFSAGIWIGGMVNGSLRVAGTTYGPYEFWPGPVEPVAAGQDCAQFDRIYRITRGDLEALDRGEAPTSDIEDWPWEFGAPVVDGDGDTSNYNLAGGDRPELLGDETLFWIMNDIGNEHIRTMTDPLGIEVHVTAFTTTNIGNTHFPNTTFYRYRVINKNALPITNTYFSMFADADLGAAFDDYVGSDSTINLAFVYNADNDDDGIYGLNPPAQGFHFTGRPVRIADNIDNDSDGLVDEPGEMIQMSSALYYSGGGAGIQSDPGSGEDMYNYAQGKWKDGTPITIGGNGLGFSTVKTTYVYSGMPPAFWSEKNVDNLGTATSPADRRVVGSVGPFDLDPGEETEVFLSMITAFGADNLDSVRLLKEAVQSIVDLTPQTVPPGNPAPPTQVPRFINIGDGAFNQPPELTLKWEWSSNPLETVLQIAEDGDFSNPVEIITLETEYQPVLEANTRYGVRIRGRNVIGNGPWSPVLAFSTSEVSFSTSNSIKHFVVTQNAAGLLDPFEMAAAAFESSGFPMFNGQESPTSRQQTNGSTWVVHTGRTTGQTSDWETFSQRSLRNGLLDVLLFGWEIRFTEPCYSAWENAIATSVVKVVNPEAGGCYAYDRFGDGKSLFPVPFEVWRTSPNGSGATSDDVRLVIAVIDSENDGFNLSKEDHPFSDGDDDPQTDWIYMYLPNDMTSGQSGYDNWLASPIDDRSEHGREVFSRIVFGNMNGGSVSADPFVPNAVMPEVGTVFRIETNTYPAPTVSYPTGDMTVTNNELNFYWYSFNRVGSHVQIAKDSEFQIVVWEDVNASTGIAPSLRLEDGTYFWRVIDLAGSESGTTRFFVAGGVDIEDESSVPNEFALDPAYPNPFNPTTTISFSLPVASEVRVAVYDMLGREVKTLVQGRSLAAGKHQVQFEAADFASGIYLIRMNAGAFEGVQKVVLLK